MEQAEYGVYQAALLERRTKLQTARVRVRESGELARLIDEVDGALKRIDDGAFGICEHCHDPIEKDRLLADPVIRFCIDHLAPADRRALEDDLSMARQIQTALLPKCPWGGAGWEAFYRYEPAGPVSGDYCDIIVDDAPCPMHFLIGDVAGKGVAASLLVSHLHSMFRSMAGGSFAIPQMLARANRLLCESTIPSQYATLVCAAARSSGQVEVSNAGHCPPVLVRSGGVSAIESSGLPMGMFCSTSYDSHAFQMNPGDTLFFYTDGLTEAAKTGDEQYGLERLIALLEACRGFTPEAMVSACLVDWAAFRSGAPQRDDLTVMAVRRGISRE